MDEAVADLMASLPLVSATAAISGYCQLNALTSLFSLKSGEERRFFERFPERIRMKEPQKVPMWGKLIKRNEEVDNTLPASKKLIYFAAGNTLRVRRVALDRIPGAARKNSEGGSWSTQPT